MLTKEDEQWLGKTYPGLAGNAKSVAGTIEFNATYNGHDNRFLVLADGVADTVGGLALSGRFKILIEERRDKQTSALPAVYVEDVEAIADRHINRIDKSACLCSPLEENEFLVPEFQFKLFLEKLVIPFLYGQLFYSLKKCWPWSEYAHGVTGILEAYFVVADPAKTRECLRRLVQDKATWPRVRAALQQKPYIKGHTPCFCPKMDKIKRCHPTAWRGALQLQQNIRTLVIPIPI
jgi:hypothetical protein